MTRIAVLADLHANLSATLAVHADIQRRRIGELWVLGDLVGKGPRPREVLEWTQEHAARVIQGNWDARVAGATHRPQDLWPRSKLTPAQLSYLSELPYGIEEEFGFNLRPVGDPPGVHTEPIQSFSLGLYPAYDPAVRS